MIRACLSTLPVILLVLTITHGIDAADQFSRLTGERLGQLTAGEGTTKRTTLNFEELEGLVNSFKDSGSKLLLVKTDQDNLAKLLVAPALKKTPGHADQLKPVLMIERLETYERGKQGKRLAKVDELLLFNGFGVDLDSGQVVPIGEGEDLIFQGGTGLAGTLKAAEKVEIWTTNAPLPDLANESGPSPGRAILPSDFQGRYQLEADGRWKGLLELNVNEERIVKGQFRSEPKGSSYNVVGEVANDTPQKIQFVIQFPRVEQEYVGYLATSGKSSIAGTFIMENRTFGFHAERESTEPKKAE